MKYRLLILLGLIFSINANANGWMRSFEDAQKVALSTNKLIVVDFWATWCGPCKKMDMDSWSDADVKKRLNFFVPLKIDIDRQHTLFSRYGSGAIPDVFILDGNGNVLDHSIGYLSPNQLKSFLDPYVLRTDYLQREALSFYKNPTPDNGILLASKNMQFSKNVNERVEHQFLNLADTYLRISGDLLDDIKGDQRETAQKLELFELLLEFNRERYRKVERQLKRKFNEKNVTAKNRGIYFTSIPRWPWLPMIKKPPKNGVQNWPILSQK